MKTSAEVIAEATAAIAAAVDVSAVHLCRAFEPSGSMTEAQKIANLTPKLRALGARGELTWLTSETNGQSWTPEQRALATKAVAAIDRLVDSYGPVAFDVSNLGVQMLGMLQARLSGAGAPPESQVAARALWMNACSGYEILPATPTT